MALSSPLRLVKQAAQPINFCCPLCGSVHAAYVFGTSEFRIFRCGGCALTFSRQLPRNGGSSSPVLLDSVRRRTRDEKQHSSLLTALDATAVEGPYIVIADLQEDLVAVIKRRGINVARIAGVEDFGSADWGETYQAAIITETLMRIPDPRAALLKIRKHLADGAPVLLSIPLLDGSQARLMGRNWHEWHLSNRWYFTRESLNLLLLSANFEHVWFRPERRSYSLDSLSERMLGGVGPTLWQRGIESLRRWAPRALRRTQFPLPFGTAVVTATAAPTRSCCVVSIVVPVFNEHSTLQQLMDALLAKQLPSMQKEIIIVESNSTDGSRDLVLAYEGHSDVRVILQAQPRGKGNAVREGLKQATGDIVLIQDADLEYDLDDYDGLLAPIAAWQSMFILGSRHQGGWKMRKFTGAPLVASIFNMGHWFFKSVINIALHTRMTDPFTMFKIFRRDALFGMDLICNRFDFDIELVIKLVRKGYVPVEMPVNYSARSFAEGKKVSFTRDGLTWLWTIIKLRLSPIGRGPA